MALKQKPFDVSFPSCLAFVIQTFNPSATDVPSNRIQSINFLGNIEC